MKHEDIREWIKVIEEDGELKRISGADWNLEMGSITEILYREGKKPVPALLFDDIPGYPGGFRTLYGLFSSPRRLSRALNLPITGDRMAVVQNLRAKMRTLKPIPPRFVDSGPLLENRLTGDAIDLNMFPVPRFHELDGGRYIGTCHSVILKDPDTGWVNLGTYRSMLVDRDHVAIHMLEGQHGRMICDKYHARGQIMPVAIAIGVPPVLWYLSTDRSVTWGVSEYDHAGGMMGEPLEVIEGPYTGLPLPAHAEIVIEGECHPGEFVDEGPFGEWMGNYANNGLETVPEPLVRVKNVLYRNSPILLCSGTTVPPSELSAWGCITRSAMYWDALEKLGIPGIKGVWSHEEGGSLLFVAISIKQMYAGHSKRVGLIANQFVSTIGKYTIVVDDDVDPSNLSDVIWAMSTRADPERAIEVISRCGTSSADTTVSPEVKRKTKGTPKPIYSSRAVIDACQPFEWKDEWYPVAKVSPDLRTRTVSKWDQLFRELC